MPHAAALTAAGATGAAVIVAALVAVFAARKFFGRPPLFCVDPSPGHAVAQQLWMDGWMPLPALVAAERPRRRTRTRLLF